MKSSRNRNAAWVVMMLVIAAAVCPLTSSAADKVVKTPADNSKADAIVGDYFISHKGEESKVRFSRNSDGTYKCQIYWVARDKDASGKKILDPKNPDKTLRDTPSDRIILINGLKHNADKKQWDDAKIYDPTRGIKANVTCKFTDDGRLSLRGSVMGIGETVYWTPIAPE